MTGTKTEKKVYVRRFRCESCFDLHPKDKLFKYNDDILCAKCKKIEEGKILPETKTAKGMQWYAMQTYLSDSKVQKSIKNRLTLAGLKNKLGQFAVPKQADVRVTKNSYSAIGLSGERIGNVSAYDADEALLLAREQFSPRSMKGVWKPDLAIKVYGKVIPILKQGTKKTISHYNVISQCGQIMAKLYCRSLKQARTTAENTYGEEKALNEAGMNGAIYKAEVAKVELLRLGGQTKLQNKRVMKGYMLIEIDPQPVVFDEIKKAKGIVSILPYGEKMSLEKYELVGQASDLPPEPAAIPVAVVENLCGRPKSTLRIYEKGDRVQIVDGPWLGMFVTLTDATGQNVGSQTLIASVSFMGRPTEIKLNPSQVKLV